MRSLTSREATERVPGSRVVEDGVSQKVNGQNEVTPWKFWLFLVLLAGSELLEALVSGPSAPALQGGSSCGDRKSVV